MLKVIVAIICIVSGIWCIVLSGQEIHAYKYHFDGTIHAVEKDASGHVMDTDANKLAKLNNTAGENYSTVFSLASGILAFGLVLLYRED